MSWRPFVRLLLGLLVVVAASAPPTMAQIVTKLGKDDCAPWNNECHPFPDDVNCDDVQGPILPPQPNRTAPLGARVQYRVYARQALAAQSDMTLEDILPPCVQLDCSSLCVDTDCDPLNTLDHAGPWVGFSAGGSQSGIVCNAATNTLRVTGINMSAGETMTVKFCAAFTQEILCCNDATLSTSGGGTTQSAVDDFRAGQPTLCVSVQPPTFWKDDCAPRTDDPATGNPDPADCDDAYTDAGQRLLPNGPGDRIKWVLHATNTYQADTYTLTDTFPGDQYVTCDPTMDPAGLGWGCYEIYENGAPRVYDPGNGEQCVPGLGTTTIAKMNMALNDELEVRVCTRADATFPADPVAGSCNHANIRGASYGRPLKDLLHPSMTDVCVNVPAQVDVSATKVYQVVGGGPPVPGAQIQWTMTVCETGGADVTVDLTDLIDANFDAGAALDPTAPRACSITGNTITCTALPILGNQCVDIIWRAFISACPAGARICNQASIIVPGVPTAVLTDDPDLPGNQDRTCFDVLVESLRGTKAVLLSTDVDSDREADCEQDRLTYTITVENTGQGMATTVGVTDVIPPVLLVVPGTTIVDGVPAPDIVSGTPISFGNVAGGDSHTISFTVDIASVADGTIVTNQATIESDFTRNCSAPINVVDPGTTISCAAVEPPDLSVDKTSGPTHGERGTPFTYTVQVCNGPAPAGPATNVRFEDVLPNCAEPQGGNWVTVDGNPVPDPYQCGAPPSWICFDLTPQLDPGDCLTVAILVQVLDNPGLCQDNASFQNTASVMSTEQNAQSNPNTSTFTIDSSGPTTELRRNAGLSADRLTPLKTPQVPLPTNWGTIMAPVGSCVAGSPRLSLTYNVIAGTAPYCIPNEIRTAGIIFYEVAGDCGSILRVNRNQCNGGGYDIEVTY